MSAPEKLREAVDAIDAEGLSEPRVQALTWALIESRRGMRVKEFQALLRRSRFKGRPFTGPRGHPPTGHPSHQVEVRRKIVAFLLSEFEGKPALTPHSIAVFFGVPGPSIAYDAKRIWGGSAGVKPGRSLSAELERARPGAAVQKKPVPTEIRHTVSAAPTSGVDGALSLTLKAIGESGDLRKYGGLVREIGKVLA